MKHRELNSMTVDELWMLHLNVGALLAERFSAEKAKVEERLEQLQAVRVGAMPTLGSRRKRRPYPAVQPKYRNPKQPNETWAGRGKQPRWLTAQLETGKKLEDFKIRQSSDRGRHSARQKA